MLNEWIYDRLPTFEDVSKNRSPYFLCVVRYNSYVGRYFFDTKNNKWYRTFDDCKKSINEKDVLAWMFMPEVDYDFIKENSKIGGKHGE